ncbi:MAG: Uma2 family endonuclease, partial [Okeania sp. SIO3C4]|nr:Uma2 family endonuclease [Okeania sp. SIO3C4]
MTNISVQNEPSIPAKETLPTMYDLPSENPEEPGLPDVFHDFQPELLRQTFQPPNWYPDKLFCGTDMNLYYDVKHPKWYKRPDWFAVV